jgi:uncharacterized protein YcfL
MKVENHEFTTVINRIKYRALLSIFKPRDQVIYRVVLIDEKNQTESVHILYEVNRPRQRFFWYDEDGKGTTTAKIAKTIVKLKL